MRSRFLVLALAALAALVVQGCGPQDSPLRSADAGSSSDAAYVWIYDEASRFHGVMPMVVQQMRHPDPVAVGNAVCASLGGNLDIMQPPVPGRERIGFNCAFTEPDLSMTTEFGELRRIRNIDHKG